MKKIIINKIYVLPALLALFCAALSSCSDWNDPESLGLDQVDIGDKNSGFYQEYLANLRSYKNTEHKVVLGWFDNSEKEPRSRGAHLAALPDSVDMVIVLYPDELADWEVSEMRALRRDKGTKILYTIDCDALTEEYRSMALENDLNDRPTEETLYEYISEGMDKLSGLLGKYDYDGVNLVFYSSPSEFLTAAELAELSRLQDMVFGKVNAELADHPDKMFVYQGAPRNIVRPEYLLPAKYVILDMTAQTGVLRVELEMEDMLWGANIPTDRTIIAVRSLSPTNEKLGWYYTEEEPDGVSAVVEIARWVAEPHRYGKSGLGIFNINDGYYNIELDYMDVREAIYILNPSPKF